MKKTILSVVALLAFGLGNAQETTSNAQATKSNTQDAKFGIKAALNIASLTGDASNPSSVIGFQIGGFAEIKVSEKFAIQPELMYSTQGVNESYSDSGLNIETDTKLGYLNIPVMVKYYATPKFSFEFGPQIGFLLSAKVEGTASFEGASYSESVDVKDQMSSVDFGLNLGAGYDFTDKFSVGVRYNFGLTNVIDISDEQKEFVGDINAKNSVFSVSVGYKF